MHFLCAKNLVSCKFSDHVFKRFCAFAFCLHLRMEGAEDCQEQGGRGAISTHTLARRVTAKAHKKAARFCSKGTALRRNCLAVVHERAAVPLLQAVFCRVILHFYGAKVPWECWALMVRTGTAGIAVRCATPSGHLPAGSRCFVRNAVFFVHTGVPSNKTAGYPTLRP